MFSFICLLLIRICIASLLRHEHECLALFEFKQSILDQSHASFNVGGFQKLDSWRKITSNASDHDSDCCLWDGVLCSKKGHVIGLDLSQSSLRGPLKSNSSLFNLVHLQMLNLSINDFVGSQIPSQIAYLKQLRSLDLSSSSFSGHIPIEISHLMKLTLLDLSWNSLKLRGHSLESLLQNLTRLEELSLSGVDISSFIPPFLANFSSLKSIDLEDCSLRGEFPSQIFYLTKLKFLSIAENRILIGFIPEFLNNSLLEHVDLYATNFAGSLPQSISKLQYLEYLFLFECNFSGCIPRSLSNMTRLTFLALGQDELMGVDPSLPRRLSFPVGLEVCEKRSMHDWIVKLTKLELLVLIRINIYDEILPALANLTKLSTVIMRSNFISGRIPSSFMNLTQLKDIDIRGNQLHGQISNSFSIFKRLEQLHLEHNNFSGIVNVDTFTGLPKLSALFLGGNEMYFVATNYSNVTLLPELEYLGLTSCNLRKFPSFLRFQKKIKFLSLENNKIKGLVPEWFLNNTQETLQYLYLSYNSITGFHGHPHFLPWVRLKLFSIKYNQLRGRLPIPPLTTVVYDVSNNNLTQEIPPLICELKHLRVLDLSSNNMTGTLPPCLGNLSTLLFVLDLKGNKFHGPMMNAFTYGSLIRKIDLTENQFTGQLPESLANCTNLEFLALGGNSFEDVFPVWLGNLAKLEVLILRSNKFFGAIQGLPNSSSSSFLKLRIIDLSNNGFCGQLPEKLFQTMNAMKSFDVGKSSFMDVELFFNPRLGYQFAYSMMFTNKGVHREFPHILKVFTAIDLSCNNFEGHIPESLSDLHGLQSINLSNNHLTGRNQFNTFDNNSYMGNHGLCGKPLFKECKIPVIPTLPPTIKEYNSFLPDDKIDWIIIFLGFGSGLVIGIVLGNFLYARIRTILKANRLWDMIEPSANTQTDEKKDITATAYLFQALQEEMIIQIANCKSPKEIWDALKTRNIGVDRVQKARLQTLKTEFEMLMMKEEDTIDSFTAKLNDIVTKASNLGTVYDQPPLVQKLLSSVPHRFVQIPRTIEQFADLEATNLDEIIGRLKSFD
ncbi:hypothetical protein E3N88_04925 [Mikania micrantha]|uniref:Leucine-rich repeat-containing N-terminal plant-type domain-containing protein n=1 Tax=Mikania micrantha TaxID=192012 RepID=A0A5N6PX85_9ASTR|nr:hypothetical protein E3N88_04925 [Mikania micrantha]